MSYFSRHYAVAPVQELGTLIGWAVLHYESDHQHRVIVAYNSDEEMRARRLCGSLNDALEDEIEL